MSILSYKTIATPTTADFRDRGSKFLAYAYPLQDTTLFKGLLSALKKEHPKAAHHCFAYRVGTEGTVFRASDDGEPSGTAGKPILGQIDSNGLTNIVVIVVRYFGGTLLGVPGLINAYKTATALALNEAVVVERPVLKMYTLEFDYTRMNEVMRIVKQHQCEVIGQDSQLFCRLEVGVPKKNESSFIERARELTGILVKGQ